MLDFRFEIYKIAVHSNTKYKDSKTEKTEKQKTIRK